MTRDGELYRLPNAERRTSENDSGSPHLCELPTPSANGEGNNTKSRGRPSLETMAKRDLWPTPTVGDSRSSGNRSLPGSKAHSGTSLTDATERAEGGKLNPEFVEWLMGWPIGWTGLEPLAMDKFRRWLRQHGVD